MSHLLGQRLEDVQPADLGSARQAWATRFAFGILGGHGDSTAIRGRIAVARAELNAATGDAHLCEQVRERIGKLSGTAALIRVGAATDAEREEIKLRVESAVTAGRAALQHGVVNGGGTALLACAPALERVCSATDDEAAGVRILAHALAEPMRAILANAGLESPALVFEARQRGPDWTFDVLQHAWLPAREAVADALTVVETALRTSVSAAATAITTEALAHRVRAPLSVGGP